MLRVALDTKKPVKMIWVLAIIILVNLLIAGIGLWTGRAYVWRNFDRTPPEELQYRSALEKVRNSPDNADHRVELGWAMFQKGMYNEALAEYKKALDLNDNHFAALYNLGLAYAKAGKHDRAISAFQRAIQINPKSFQPHYDLGKAYLAAGKANDAVNELEIAYRLNPGSVDVIYELGQAYEKLSRPEEAIYRYESALKFDPKFQPAIQALARLNGTAR